MLQVKLPSNSKYTKGANGFSPVLTRPSVASAPIRHPQQSQLSLGPPAPPGQLGGRICQPTRQPSLLQTVPGLAEHLVADSWQVSSSSAASALTAASSSKSSAAASLFLATAHLVPTSSLLLPPKSAVDPASTSGRRHPSSLEVRQPVPLIDELAVLAGSSAGGSTVNAIASRLMLRGGDLGMHFGAVDTRMDEDRDCVRPVEGVSNPIFIVILAYIFSQIIVQSCYYY
ncbi:unnamed protein product [Protopolystoma xenopodis]|uniref:Uncharacterized protein n=1 Tax=Protopolystoma xenopodis TaxID=117903 RepID=A0A448WQ63_9PLAT|nr:unnamed protein product [Protopolystoma xenopodis]